MHDMFCVIVGGRCATLVHAILTVKLWTVVRDVLACRESLTLHSSQVSCFFLPCQITL